MPMEYLPVDRVKRLNKDELTKLLSDLLKKSVRKGYDLDSQYQTQENWEIKYTEKLTPSEYMDKVEGKHWRANPDEPFDSYLNRSKIWWDGVHPRDAVVRQEIVVTQHGEHDAPRVNHQYAYRCAGGIVL